VQIPVNTSCTFACPATAALAAVAVAAHDEIMFSCIVYRDSFTKSVRNCVHCANINFFMLNSDSF
jgi:hypothetical protein